MRCSYQYVNTRAGYHSWSRTAEIIITDFVPSFQSCSALYHSIHGIRLLTRAYVAYSVYLILHESKLPRAFDSGFWPRNVHCLVTGRNDSCFRTLCHREHLSFKSARGWWATHVSVLKRTEKEEDARELKRGRVIYLRRLEINCRASINFVRVQVKLKKKKKKRTKGKQLEIVCFRQFVKRIITRRVFYSWKKLCPGQSVVAN